MTGRGGDTGQEGAGTSQEGAGTRGRKRAPAPSTDWDRESTLIFGQRGSRSVGGRSSQAAGHVSMVIPLVSPRAACRSEGPLPLAAVPAPTPPSQSLNA